MSASASGFDVWAIFGQPPPPSHPLCERDAMGLAMRLMRERTLRYLGQDWGWAPAYVRCRPDDPRWVGTAAWRADPPVLDGLAYWVTRPGEACARLPPVEQPECGGSDDLVDLFGRCAS